LFRAKTLTRLRLSRLRGIFPAKNPDSLGMGRRYYPEWEALLPEKGNISALRFFSPMSPVNIFEMRAQAT
jgi:hypothetical protein